MSRLGRHLGGRSSDTGGDWGVAGHDGGGHIDGGPHNVGDSFPHDFHVALDRGGRGGRGEEGAGQGEGFGNRSHCGLQRL